jgi:hypothetical protein
MNPLVHFEKQKQEIDYYRTLAAIAAKSNTTQLSPEVMLNIMLTARDLGISPLKAVNGGFYVVNGKISMSTALMADRIRKEGHSIRIPEWTSEKCVMIGIRKDNGDSVKFEFTMQDAQTAGLTNSPTWKKFPKQMLYNRAMSTLARTLFPDVVGNAYSEDEKWDIMNVPAENRPEEDPDTMTVEAKQPQLETIIIGSPFETLKEHLAVDGIDTEYLETYLSILAEKKKQTVEQIIESALMPALLARFKTSYLKELAKLENPDPIAV